MNHQQKSVPVHGLELSHEELLKLWRVCKEAHDLRVTGAYEFYSFLEDIRLKNL